MVPRALRPVDLLPGDLDLVVRIDVARLKAAFGKDALEKLFELGRGSGDAALFAKLLVRADTLWVGTRLADLDAGDRVVVAEGDFAEVALVPPEWKQVDSSRTGVSVWEVEPPVRTIPKDGGSRRASLARDAFARGVALGPRSFALVSAAELDPVTRVLAEGPDGRALEPRDQGLLSAALRVRSLPPALAEKYPSAASVLGGVARAQAVADLRDDEMVVAIELVGRSEAGAEKAARFFEAVLGALGETNYAGVVKGNKPERLEATVRLTLVVTAGALRAVLGGSDGGAAEASEGR